MLEKDVILTNPKTGDLIITVQHANEIYSASVGERVCEKGTSVKKESILFVKNEPRVSADHPLLFIIVYIE